MILVGGHSGSGKTALVDALLNASRSLARPRSITTRERRSGEGEEYEFVSLAQFEEMSSSGMLANDDEMYGNRYGIEWRSLNELWARGVTVVKEVHPLNFHKLERICSHCYTVMLTNGRPAVREGDARIAKDRSYFGDLNRLLAMARLLLRSKTREPQELAKIVLRAFAWTRSTGFEVDCRVVERVNDATYSRLAEYFTDNERLTTRNFHDASHSRLLALLDDLPSGSEVLELGAGTGWLRSVYPRSRELNWTEHDGSHEMAKTRAHEVLVSSPRALPVNDESFDSVVGSLIDGMLYTEAFIEVARVLRPRGRFILSFPSPTWAMLARDGQKLAKFSHGGQVLEAFSFSPTFAEIQELASSAEMDLRGAYEEGATTPPYSPALYSPEGGLISPVVTVAELARR